MKGTVFEIELSMHFEGYRDILCIPNVRVYSRFLQRATEIDRLLVTTWGLYSVEQKSYSSRIVGELSDEYWLGITGRTSTQIYNPIMQNFEHIRSLRNEIYRLAHYDIPIMNYVVVPDTCIVQTESPMVMNIQQFVNMVHRDAVSKSKLPFSIKEFLHLLEKVKV